MGEVYTVELVGLSFALPFPPGKSVMEPQGGVLEGGVGFQPNLMQPVNTYIRV